MNRLLLPIIVALVLVACNSQVGQDNPAMPLLTGIGARDKVVSLAGTWATIIDPYQTGYYNYRREPDPNGYFRDAVPRDPGQRIEYSFDSSPTLRVPGDWNSQSDSLLFYEGAIWYRRTFAYSLAEGRRLFLYVGAANYYARAWLNGHYLGEHEGGFTPFVFEITEALQDSLNHLVFMVDNTRRPDAVPTVNTDWWNYGGLTRDVKLVEVPETYIRDVHVRLTSDEPHRLEVSVALAGSQRAGTPVRIDFPSLGLTSTTQSDSQGLVRQLFTPGQLALWSPDDPVLHAIELSAGQDRWHDQVGLRHLATQENRILLNGEPVFLKGICLHEESLLHDGRAHGSADAVRLLQAARELGCNFVRLAHYPHDESMLRAADSLGILVWAEVPVYWTIQWQLESTLVNARQQLGEMIWRDRNRASVILWSVANETPPSAPRLKFLKNLIDLTRTLDPDRLLTAALEVTWEGQYSAVVKDELGRSLDVLGCNEYIGWYGGTPEDAASTRWSSPFRKPLIISEFGAGAKYGFRGDSLAVWTEEYQARIYRNQLAMLDNMEILAGVTPWILKDFRSPRRPLPGVQDYWNRKGLLSENGERKLAWEIYRSWQPDLLK